MTIKKSGVDLVPEVNPDSEEKLTCATVRLIICPDIPVKCQKCRAFAGALHPRLLRTVRGVPEASGRS